VPLAHAQAATPPLGRTIACAGATLPDMAISSLTVTGTHCKTVSRISATRRTASAHSSSEFAAAARPSEQEPPAPAGRHQACQCRHLQCDRKGRRPWATRATALARQSAPWMDASPISFDSSAALRWGKRRAADARSARSVVPVAIRRVMAGIGRVSSIGGSSTVFKAPIDWGRLLHPLAGAFEQRESIAHVFVEPP